MTDRHRSVTVLLDSDMRSDDLESVLSAIRRIRGVESVEPGPVVDIMMYLATESARASLRRQLLEILLPTPTTKGT